MEEIKTNAVNREKKTYRGLVSRFKDPKFKISRKGKWYAIIPGILAVIGLIIALTVGMNLGRDFTGGQVWNVTGVASDTAVIETIRNEASTVLGGTADIVSLTDRIEIHFNLSDSTIYNLEFVTNALRTAIVGAFPTAAVSDPDTISASQSSDHIITTIIAVVAALGAILLYMLFRFKFTSGVAATVGLIHDILVMFALTIIFQVQINAAFIAALITVVAYSLNNTLILFDRIRNLEKNNEKRLTSEMITDKAVKETFGRTMNTMITTLVPIFVLIVAGVPAIRDFALPIFFGLVAGIFSTIFLTTALYVRFENAKKFKLGAKKTYNSNSNTKKPLEKKTFKLNLEKETAES